MLAYVYKVFLPLVTVLRISSGIWSPGNKKAVMQGIVA